MNISMSFNEFFILHFALPFLFIILCEVENENQ